MKSGDFKINNQILKDIISGYTRESGVRNLEKQIAKLIRNRAKNIVSKSKLNDTSDINYLKNVLGPKKFFRDKYENNSVAGVVTGLAWTSVGGEILFIESSLSKGKGQLSLTGNLGDVMKESATIALEYLKASMMNDPRIIRHYENQAFVRGRDFAAEGIARGDYSTIKLVHYYYFILFAPM